MLRQTWGRPRRQARVSGPRLEDARVNGSHLSMIEIPLYKMDNIYYNNKCYLK